jgi:hypothetical protein
VGARNSAIPAAQTPLSQIYAHASRSKPAKASPVLLALALCAVRLALVTAALVTPYRHLLARPPSAASLSDATRRRVLAALLGLRSANH